eukprot:12268297-Alexandrium_andersonii.AAC.1
MSVSRMESGVLRIPLVVWWPMDETAPPRAPGCGASASGRGSHCHLAPDVGSGTPGMVGQ